MCHHATLRVRRAVADVTSWLRSGQPAVGPVPGFLINVNYQCIGDMRVRQAYVA